MDAAIGEKGRSFPGVWDALLAAYALPEPPTDAEMNATWALFMALGWDPDVLEYLVERAQVLGRGEEERFLVGFVQALLRGDVTCGQYEEAQAALRDRRESEYCSR